MIGSVCDGRRQSGVQHGLGRGGGAGKLGRDHALAHDKDAVRNAEHLGQLARDDDDARPRRCEGLDERVDFTLRADVDAAGRFIEHHDPHRFREPAGEDGFLLIAAGEQADKGGG